MGFVEFMVEKMVVQWRSDEWWLKFGGLLVGLYRATDIIMEKFFIHTPDDLTLSPNSQEKLVRDNPPGRIFQIKKIKSIFEIVILILKMIFQKHSLFISF